MTSVTVNTREVAQDLQRYSQRQLDSIVGAVKIGAEMVASQAKLNAPVDKGALRSSIRGEVELVGGQEVEGFVYSNIDYAPYQEFGTGIHAANGQGRKTPWFVKLDNGDGFWTSGNRAQPFLYPALVANRRKVIDLIKAAIRGAR